MDGDEARDVARNNDALTQLMKITELVARGAVCVQQMNINASQTDPYRMLITMATCRGSKANEIEDAAVANGDAPPWGGYAKGGYGVTAPAPSAAALRNAKRLEIAIKNGEVYLDDEGNVIDRYGNPTGRFPTMGTSRESEKPEPTKNPRIIDRVNGARDIDLD